MDCISNKTLTQKVQALDASIPAPAELMLSPARALFAKIGHCFPPKTGNASPRLGIGSPNMGNASPRLGSGSLSMGGFPQGWAMLPRTWAMSPQEGATLALYGFYFSHFAMACGILLIDSRQDTPGPHDHDFLFPESFV